MGEMAALVRVPAVPEAETPREVLREGGVPRQAPMRKHHFGPLVRLCFLRPSCIVSSSLSCKAEALVVTGFQSCLLSLSKVLPTVSLWGWTFLGSTLAPCVW
eukprot:RCo035690